MSEGGGGYIATPSDRRYILSIVYSEQLLYQGRLSDFFIAHYDHLEAVSSSSHDF